MIERDMEDLIAGFPEDFFRRGRLVLKGRQQSFAGAGRFDLLFEDEFGTNILMELKARAAKYEDATQLAKYKEELERRGEQHVLMWLVAPHVPSSVREFLDRIGIEYTEIHVAEFRRVAERHGAPIKSEIEGPEVVATAIAGRRTGHMQSTDATSSVASRSTTPQVATGPVVTVPSRLRWRTFGYDLTLEERQDLDRNRFDALVEAFERAVPSKRNASVVRELRAWAADPQRMRLAQGTYSSLLRWVITSGWKDAVPHAEAVWKYLFGEPAPTWRSWNKGKGYRFDPEAWKVWFESLSRVPAGIEAIYREHNGETARSWPAEKQCQCKDCKTYRKMTAGS